MTHARSLLCSLLLGSALAPFVRADSIWAAAGGDRSMFADHKAAQSGDILTIVVQESAVASSTQSKKTERASSIEDALNRFLYAGLGAHKGEMPSISASGSATNSGSGQINNSQTLSSRTAVLVTDVLPNRNLVIEGVRVVTFSKETQYVVLHGLVRPDDIAPDNTIQSSNIADARVEFISEGSLTDAQKRGWLTKLYDKLRPF